MNQDKEKLRRYIAQQKNTYTTEDLLHKSEEIFAVLEITGQFRDAQHIFIYNAMAGEVATSGFIEKWRHEKKFYQPVVVRNDLVFRRIDQNTQYTQSKIGVKEPLGENFTEIKKVDLIIVPGLAFDRTGNRLGRGKGYYDRFLATTKALKVGVCFDFQLIESLPHNNSDVKMDMIVSENDLIW